MPNRVKQEIDERSTINLKMAVTIVMVVCGAVVSFADSKRDIQDLKLEVKTLQSQLDKKVKALQQKDQQQLESRWRSLDDYLFMKEYTELNQLKMPPNHKGLMYE